MSESLSKKVFHITAEPAQFALRAVILRLMHFGVLPYNANGVHGSEETLTKINELGDWETESGQSFPGGAVIQFGIGDAWVWGRFAYNDDLQKHYLSLPLKDGECVPGPFLPLPGLRVRYEFRCSGK